jgi:predicted ATPase
MTSVHHDLIVITGGPGAGKTTLIDMLRDNGLTTTPEAGRAIIQDQSAIGGTGLPWDDAALFAELMLSWDIRSYRWALRQTGPVFFDHAVPCVAGYFRLLGQDVPEHVEAAVAAFPYRPLVFIAPPWPEIYRTDTERHQSLDEAQRTHDAMAETYTRYGYDLVELPRCDPHARLQFVLHHITRDRVGPAISQTVCPGGSSPLSSSHPQGSGPGLRGEGGAPHRTNDLRRQGLVCSACPGTSAEGRG